MNTYKQPNLFSRDERPFGKYRLSVSDNIKYLNSIKSGSTQLVVTSPPYNIGKEYEEIVTIENYIKNQEAVIEQCARIVDETGSICWQVGNSFGKDNELFPLDIILYPVFKKFDLILRNRIIWSFGHGLHSGKRFSGRHETILWFTKSDKYKFHLDRVRVPQKYPNKKHFKGPNRGKLSSNPLGKNPSDVWDIPNVKANHVEKTDHPCQFPVELVERLILALTDEGDLVVDPYVGVGSTVVAAVKNGRNSFGCDLDQTYIAIARKRMAALKRGELRTRPMFRPIYEPGR